MADISAHHTIKRRQEAGVDLIDVDRPECTATVSLLGGQLLAFQPRVSPHPIFWENPELDYSGKSALRQGIPLCGPWFGDLERNPDTVKAVYQAVFKDRLPPAHGLWRQTSWELASVTEDDASSTVVLKHVMPDFPLSVQVSYQFSEAMKMTLSVTNESLEELPVACACHTYLAVSDIEKVEICGLNEKTYYDALDEWQKHKQTGPLIFSEEVDRVYLDTPPSLHLNDKGWHRQLSVTAPDSRSSVIWNPWVDKARRLSQFPDEGYRQMVCIETAKVMDDIWQLKAEDTVRLTLTIKER